jgi:hypothetical protein
MMLILCAALLTSAGSCAAPGGNGLFCDVVPGPITFPEDVAQAVVRGARQEAVNIAAQNGYGERNCGW